MNQRKSPRRPCDFLRHLQSVLGQGNLMDARRHGLVDIRHAAVVEDDGGMGDVASGVSENRLDQQTALPKDGGTVVNGGVVEDRDGQRQGAGGGGSEQDARNSRMHNTGSRIRRFIGLSLERQTWFPQRPAAHQGPLWIRDSVRWSSSKLHFNVWDVASLPTGADECSG